MILPVFPVSYGDFMLARALAERIVKLGGMQDHEALVVSSWRVKLDAPEIVAILAKGFKKVDFTVPEFEDEAWPAGPNSMFIATADYLETKDNTLPWFWLESDVFPFAPGWLETWEKEYAQSKKPYMGHINISRYKNLETGARFEKGHHLMGVATYPADYMRRCKMIQSVPATISWDTWTGEEVVPETHDTNLLAHRWGTCRYRRNEKNQIVMDAVDPVNYHDYSVPIPEEAVLVHGCKDGSIYTLYENQS